MLQIPPEKLKEILIKEELVNISQFEEIEKEAKRLGHNLAEALIARRVITEDYFTDLLSRYFKVPKADLGTKKINEKTFGFLSQNLARQKRAAVFDQEPNGVFDVAMEDPGDLEAIEFLEKHLQGKIKVFLATANDLARAFSLYGQKSAEEFKKIIEENIQASLQLRVKGEEEAALEVPIVATVDNLLAYAISRNASDIHLEVLEDVILIRYRIDGVLYEILRIPKEVLPPIVARVKLISGLRIDEHRMPQDGRFRYKIVGEEMDIRVAVMPTFYGEKVVMRLLRATSKPMGFAELGLLDYTIKFIEENIKKTYGMLLVCGPTGCGKTTTLYAVLNILNKTNVNIVSIEDPIEYSVPYVNQTQVNPQAGITFANGLRAFLRQDPNIIMVGEIRDEETAEIAVHSALTGHLVLSSLHTNDAPTAIPRLMDMKIVPFLVAAVLNVIVAQRLVRRICRSCLESFSPSRDLIAAIEQQARTLGGEVRVPKIFYRGKGCVACNQSGFSGRLGVFEVLNITDTVRQLIVSPNFSLDALKLLARKEGMVSMFEDGIRKVELGLTTVEEVLRVIRE